MVYFVGAGSGAPDLITVRGKNLLEQADVIIYAGSLVNPELLSYKKEGCEVYNSATMTLEEVLEVMEQAHAEQKMIVRLHTGDPCIYGAIREQMDRLDEKNIPYESCPGVSAFCGARSSPESGIYASECVTERGHYPYGRTDTGAGAGTYCFFCSASCNDGCVPQYRLTGRTFKGTDCRRVHSGYTGSHCI